MTAFHSYILHSHLAKICGDAIACKINNACMEMFPNSEFNKYFSCQLQLVMCKLLPVKLMYKLAFDLFVINPVTLEFPLLVSSLILSSHFWLLK